MQESKASVAPMTMVVFRALAVQLGDFNSQEVANIPWAFDSQTIASRKSQQTVFQNDLFYNRFFQNRFSPRSVMPRPIEEKSVLEQPIFSKIGFPKPSFSQIVFSQNYVVQAASELLFFELPAEDLSSVFWWQPCQHQRGC